MGSVVADLFFKVPAEMMRRTDITPAAKLIYAVLTNRMAGNNTCWPGIRRLAADCGLGRSTVLECISALEDLRIIRVDRPRGNPVRRTNQYALGNQYVPESGRTEKRTYQKASADVPESGRGRTEKRTHLDQENKIKRTRPMKGAPSDPWELALAAMKGDTLKTDAFKATWLDWTEYRHQTGKKLAAKSVERQIHSLEAVGLERAIATINQSIEKGWQGLFTEAHRDFGRKPVATLEEKITVPLYKPPGDV